MDIQELAKSKSDIKNLNKKKWIEITSSQESFWKMVNNKSEQSEAHKKLMEVRQYMNAVLVEREIEIDYILAALISKQSGFLFGVPGTAKSMTIATLAGCFEDMKYFQYLIHQSSTPEDVFGPISIKALKEDKLRYNTEGFLPSSQVAFLDEIFKGNAGLLNGLLTIINEKKFYNGGETQNSPLESVFCASNEIPEDPSLRALYDRLVFRIKVDPVSKNGMNTVLKLSEGLIKLPEPPKLTREDLEEMRKEAANLQVSQETLDALMDVRVKVETTFAGKLEVSARRYAMILKLMRGFSYLLGHDGVSANIIPKLYNCIWDSPDQIEQCKQMLFGTRSAEMTFLLNTYNQCLAEFAKYSMKTTAFQQDSRQTLGAEMSEALDLVGVMLNDYILSCFVCAQNDKNIIEEELFVAAVKNVFVAVEHLREQRSRIKSSSPVINPIQMPTIR